MNLHNILTQKKYQKPENFQQYMEGMKANGVEVKPSINRQGQLQGFRFEFQGQSFKGSEINRNMSMAGIGRELTRYNAPQKIVSPNNTIKLPKQCPWHLQSIPGELRCDSDTLCRVLLN